MKKLVNFRPLLFVFLGVCFGILTLSFCYAENKTNFYIALTICLIMLISSIVLFLLKNKVNFAGFHAKNLLIIFLSIVLGFCLSASVVGAKLKNANSIFGQMEDYKFNCIVKATVAKDCSDDKYVLNNINIDGQNYDNIKIKITFRFADDTKLTLGDTIVFGAKLFANIQDEEKLNTSLLTDKIYYYGYNTDQVEILSSNPNIFQLINIKTTENLNEYAGDNAGIFKALLLGDKSDLNDETYDSFKLSGLAHVLSVSGLHIGFIALLFVWILKKLKVTTKIQFVLMLGLLLFYSAICGFSNSVIRASIMCLCLLLSRVIGEQNDMLSGLSLAGIILILINPLNVLNIGFQLSFLSVGGIILLYSPINKFLEKFKIPKIIRKTFAITVSATLFTLPVVAENFGFITPISLLSNFVILPIFSAIFAVLFLVFLFSLILPVGALFYPLSFLFSGITAVVYLLSKFSVIALDKIDFLTLCLYYVSLFTLSKFLMIKNKSKIIAFACGMVLCLVSVVMIRTDFSPASDKVIVIQNTNSAFVVQTKQNQNILVLPKSSSVYDSKNISNTLSNNKIYSLDEIFLPNYTPSQNQTVLNLAEIYHLSKIVLPIEEQENSVMLYSSLKRNGIICYEDFSIYQVSNTLTLKSVFDSKNLKAICIEYQNGIVSKNFLQIVENLTESQANKIIPNLPNNIDYLCLETYTASAQKLLESEISFSRVLTKDNLYLSASEKALLNIQTNGGLVASKKFVF